MPVNDGLKRRTDTESDRLGVLSTTAFRKEVNDLIPYFSVRDKNTLVDELIRLNISDKEEQKKFFEYFEDEYMLVRPSRGESNQLTQFYLEKGMKKNLKKNYKKISVMSEVIRALVSFYWKKYVEPKNEKVLEIYEKAKAGKLHPEKVIVLKDYYSILIKRED